MSRYNTEIDINEENNSHAKILGMVKPDSSVLEFGPADGYMTRYMRQELNCSVFIIELDKDSFDRASEFADGGVCGNIEDYGWTKALKGKAFDYILFADVLEHLANPENALKNAVKFLKYDGRVLLSVPNIAHSSIIIALMQNKFDYRSVGLLDETHLKHFTYGTLKNMLGNAGLFPVSERASYAFPFNTEFGNHYRDLSGTAQKTLAEKEFGTVYQFIFECAKNNYVEANRDKLTATRLIHDLRFSETLKIYAERDGSLDEHNTIEKPLYFGGNDMTFDLPEFNAERVRLDFGDFPATVTLHEININDTAQDLSSLDGNHNARIGNTLVFNHGDPFIFIGADTRIEKLHIKLSYDVTAFEGVFSYASEVIGQKTNENLFLAQAKAAETAELAVQLGGLSASLAAKEEALKNREAEFESLAAERNAVIAERDGLNAALAALEEAKAAEIDSLNAALVVLEQAKATEAESLNLKLSEVVDSLEKTFEEVLKNKEAEFENLAAERNAVIAERDTAIAERDTMTTERDGLNAALAALEEAKAAEAESLNLKLNELSGSLENAQTMLNAKADELKASQEWLGLLETEKGELGASLAAKEEALKNKEGHIELLLESERKLQSELSSIKAELSESQSELSSVKS